MTEILLSESMNIVNRAIVDHDPYAVVLMLSGGDDSMTAGYVAKSLGIKVDFVLHGVTGTGIPEANEFARLVAPQFSDGYIEADAGDKYERYVLRKGFFGVGLDPAHKFAYHVLKKENFVHALSVNIRQRKRGRKIILLNGARRQESDNRRRRLIDPIRVDGSNIWVNIINEWSKRDCLDFIRDSGGQRSPVAALLHRSGECLCGTTQTTETRMEASFFFPAWGKWLDDLESRVAKKGFCWKWGEDVPPEFKARKNREKAIRAGQMDLFDDWLPMCQTCVALSAIEEKK